MTSSRAPPAEMIGHGHGADSGAPPSGTSQYLHTASRMTSLNYIQLSYMGWIVGGRIYVGLDLGLILNLLLNI